MGEIKRAMRSYALLRMEFFFLAIAFCRLYFFFFGSLLQVESMKRVRGGNKGEAREEEMVRDLKERDGDGERWEGPGEVEGFGKKEDDK